MKKFSVSFYLRSNYKTKDGKTPVLVRINLNKQRISLGSAGCNVKAEKWNSAKARVDGRTAEVVTINHQLDQIEQDLMMIYRRHEFDEKLSLEYIKALYLGSDKGNSESFLKFFDNYLEMTKAEVGIKRCLTSYNRFVLIRERFELFIKNRYKRNDLNMSEITFKVISDFEHFLLTEFPISNNTAMYALKKLKTVIIYANQTGVMTQNPYTTFKIHFDKVDRGYLTDEEIEKIMNKEMPLKRLEQVRDIFVFSIFTGLAYTDVANLTQKNIVMLDGRKWIMKNREKTDVPSNIILLDIPEKILKKYKAQMKDDEKGRLLPIISNQRINSYLKEIADICGIEKRLSYHLARHTFATMALTKGVPIESVSKMLGHTNIQTTQQYARIINKKVEADMLQLSAKLDNFRAHL